MKWEGCYTALVTPFEASGRVDEAALRRLVRRQISGGVSGLVACGSTGESAALTTDEHRRVVEICLAEAQGRLPVIAGVSANATWKAVELAREAEKLGADALLVLVPYYNKPTQAGLEAHFRAVARGCGLPIIAYNIPGRTAVNLLPATLARIAESCPNVVAVKEAAGSVDQASEIIQRLPTPFSVLSGDDSLTLAMMAVGARGVVSVVSNVAPKETTALCRHALDGELPRARRLQARLLPLMKALFLETNPIPIKAALGMMGLCRPNLRLPLTPMSAQPAAALRRELRALGFI